MPATDRAPSSRSVHHHHAAASAPAVEARPPAQSDPPRCPTKQSAVERRCLMTSAAAPLPTWIGPARASAGTRLTARSDGWKVASRRRTTACLTELGKVPARLTAPARPTGGKRCRRRGPPCRSLSCSPHDKVRPSVFISSGAGAHAQKNPRAIGPEGVCCDWLRGQDLVTTE